MAACGAVALLHIVAILMIIAAKITLIRIIFTLNIVQ